MARMIPKELGRGFQLNMVHTLVRGFNMEVVNHLEARVYGKKLIMQKMKVVPPY